MVRIGLGASVLACVMVMAAGWIGRSSVVSAQDTKPPASTGALLNLNAATAADLEKLPGVGPAMATRILEYRQKSGGFKKIEELMNVQGIGEKNFLRLKPLITIAPAKIAER
jgi:competence protein ComEA